MELKKKKNTTSKKVDLNPTILMFILNINGVNISIKRQKSSYWIKRCKTQHLLSINPPKI